MNQTNRILKIQDMLNEKGELSTKEIMKVLQVSQDTARRDIVKLVDMGLAIRTHGGVLSLAYQKKLIPNYSERNLINPVLKNKLAEETLKYIHQNETCFIATSTIFNLLCKKLDQSLRVYTHSLDNMNYLSTKPYIEAHLLGGRFFPKNRFFYGVDTLKRCERIRFDTAIVGCASITKEGAFLEDEEDALIVEAAIHNSQRIILVAENTKFNGSSVFKICDLHDVDVFITNKKSGKNSHTHWFPDEDIVVEI
ncbi:DeoR/GlpR family DNA-binding transcription regulator [Vagococcus humatus]|uniref:DeoR/GlpR transcriptional regulator n=1 Tax=Vagococcus humatus TaxID=1889241 RepID=A0A3R9YKS0_9ENTE|nr:DeoR/GlpR family DNA-binding transcription regulator [Vagococcus humatus]RST89963.1 DeoR/GlpR transcriptional regulator [Vagococcus humatus]